MKKVFELIRKAGPSDANALICGESGTGKELAALDLHHRGPRAGGPFVPINCGGLPSSLQEQELFGSVAHEPRCEGRIREAHGGTLFLDEVSELTAPLQAKLLRAIEDKAVRPIGGKRAFEADVRYLAASSRDLEAAVERGYFRKDLYYRLNVISLHLPPLRHRGPDVLLIAGQFLQQYARKLGKPVRGFDAEFSAFMRNYPWPGNVRELENFVQRAVILAEGELLTGRDLGELAPALPMVRASAPPAPGARPLAIEEYIREVVERFQGTHTESELAKMLGIGRKALWMRRRQWGLRRSDKADR